MVSAFMRVRRIAKSDC